MSVHWNIQINIQRVVHSIPAAPVKRGYQDPVVGGTKRDVIQVMELKITADSEAEAYAKAHRMLNANEPQEIFTLTADDIPIKPQPHLHRASCDDAGGNHVCGFPDGPSIASGAPQA